MREVLDQIIKLDLNNTMQKYEKKIRLRYTITA